MYHCAAALWFCSDFALFNNVSTVPVFGTVPVPNCINFNEFLREVFIYFLFSSKTEPDIQTGSGSVILVPCMQCTVESISDLFWAELTVSDKQRGLR